jgi:malate permease and related proteins
MSPAVVQTLPILCLMAVGCLLKQAGLIRSGDGQVLTRLIVNATLPAVIFLSVARANVSPARLALLASCGFLLAVTQRAVAGQAVRWFKFNRAVAGVVILGAMIVNVGFFLYPIFLAVYGQEGLSRLAAFDVGNSLVASSYGYYLATRHGDRPPSGVWRSLRRTLALPLLWAALAGLAVNLARLNLPGFVLKLLEPLGSANTPLAMITLGSFLQFRLRNWKPLLLTVGLRMGLGLILGLALVAMFQLQGLERAAVLLATAMPSGMVVLIYSAAVGLDTELAAGVVSLGLMAGVFVAPALLSIYG